MAMLTTVKGLPLAYNKDLQEDKEGLFDAIDTIKFSLAVYAQLIRGMKVRKDVMLKLFVKTSLMLLTLLIIL